MLIKTYFNKIIFNFLSLLQDLVNLLKPFLDATKLLSGSKYSTLNFVYPTMYYLISEFAPKNEESEDDLFDLIYGPIQANEIEYEDNRGNCKILNFIIYNFNCIVNINF
jgi:hypothetical protein